MRFIIAYILFTLSLSGSLYGASYKSIEQFSLSNGLPNNGVTSLLQDSKGYLWIGTYDGLARYNGHTLTTYTNSIESKIFQSNRIRSLFEAPNLNIWIGTDFGVTVFDCRMEQFINLESISNSSHDKECIIREIMLSEDKSHVYCLSERNGVLIYNLEGKLLKHLTIDREAIFQDAFHLDGEKYLLVSNKGIELYDFESTNTQTIFKIGDLPNLEGSLTDLDDNTLLLGYNYGIRKINYSVENGSYQFVVHKEEYSQCGYKTLQVDSNGGLWIGSTFQGLFYLPDAINNWGKPLEKLSEAMRHSAFLSSYSESMWVATFDNGLMKYHREQQYFKNLDLSDLAISPIRTVQIVPYDDHSLLYQNSYQNLSLYDLDSGKQGALPFTIEDQELLNLQYVARLDNGDVWLFMSNGTKSWRLINPKGSKKLYRIDDELMDDFVYAYPYTITQDYLGYLWIGNAQSLSRIELGDHNRIKNINSINEHSISQEVRVEKINSIYSDPQSESIWFGSSSQGLFHMKYDQSARFDSAQIINYKSDESNPNALSSNFVAAINRCNSILWIATEQGGLCRVNESGHNLKFTPYGTSDGLPSNSIKSILSDFDGDLWVSTNFGLSKYDQSNDRFMIYQAEQGVPYDEFTYKAFSMGETMIFGALRNICYFKPAALPQSSPAPRIEFTNLKVYNDIIMPTQEFNDRVVLSHALTNGDKIKLKYNENMLSIGVDALYGDHMHDKDIRYRVLPLSNQWISIPYNTQEITLSGLRHGDYTLEVVTSDFFGQKSNASTLQIVITPPFWLSVWAYILYALLVIAIATAVILIISNLQKLRYRLHIEQINKHNAEVMNTEKLRYFSNISHELKTPLTLIVAPLSLLLDRFVVDVDVRSKLDIIKRQSDKIIRLIDLAHGIELSDSNLLKRNDSRFSFNNFVGNIIDDFKLMSSYDDKSFVVDSPQVDIIVEADSEMLEKIINNLLSNAFKYTRGGHSIKLSYMTEGENLTISVEDSGYGISTADVDHLFERFFRARQRGSANVGGTGIGLYFTKTLVELHGGVIDVESEINRGSKFTVSLPIVREQHNIEVEEQVTSGENYKEQILGELTIERISSEGEFKDSMVYIVEDNSEMRQFVSSVISKFFCIKTFANGAECHEAMKDQWPDIVVSDVMMPVMDGYELCEALKSDMKTSHIPIILLTACSTVDDKIKGLKYGADAYIPKPFYPNHMITRIETLLTNRKQLRERFQINMPIVYGETSSMRAKDNDFLERLYQIFSENLDNEELDVELIVSEFGINRNLFFQKVKAITNASPRELLLTYRLKRAAEYLQSGERNVNEACDLTGFKSRSHFSRLFKEKYGVSPSQYGKKI